MKYVFVITKMSDEECLFALNIFAYNDGNFCLGARIKAMIYLLISF